ncbi:MAG: dTDP-4-dehydrorhamnose 3,5-epimerase [Actinobacteria bacterium]|nr:dTDP-4-dehydrorhamnose 3,5-epimerase [Actinomycetota bacterium]MBI3686625.1 dTDP-4-dehydrorhamnose 3,5-epimerase [Actinomycetota bacterium]
MKIRELAVPGSWEFTLQAHGDDRGSFCEWYRAEAVTEAVGHPLALVQANHSTSRRGVVRGIHYAEVPPSQAKYVYCPLGAVLDVVVDIRVGSPTFGRWDAVRLDDTDRRAVYLSEGLGHAFCALTDDAAVTYLCSTGYAPAREHGVHPLDPALGLPWPADVEPALSGKDAAAPTLAEAAEQGLLPSYQACLDYYDLLRSSGQ